MQTIIKKYISSSVALKETILNDAQLSENIENIVKLIINAYNDDKKVLTAGNGGSAADAQHLVAELVNKFYLNRKALSAIALSVDTSVITSIANDSGYENIFSRQIEANADKGDVFIAFSTSGKSANIIKAVKQAKKQGVFTVCFLGGKKSELDKICDFTLKVPSYDTPQIQESHIMLVHIICMLIEKNIF